MSKMRKFHGLPKTVGLSFELASPYVIILVFAVTIWTSAYTDQPVDFLESSITETNKFNYLFRNEFISVFITCSGFELKIV